MTNERIRPSLTLDDLHIIEDALYYYRASTEQGGPDDHHPAEIRRVERLVGRYVSRAEGSDR